MTKRRKVHHTPANTIKFTAQEVADYQAGVRRFASLVVVGGSDADIGHHVLLTRPVSIGRDPEIEMPLQDAGISRKHARVYRDERLGRYMVEDLGSTNGTRLEGIKLTKPAPLGEGDKIFLGGTVLKFAYTDELEIDFHQKVEQIVGTDHLTGLEARHRFDASYGMAFRAALDSGRPLAVLMMDMDGVKPINDTYGHHVGAYAIAEVGKIIADVLQPHGRSCRYGGDEFMAYLPGVDKTAAHALGEQVRARVDKHPFVYEGTTLKPTLSVGVAALPEDVKTPEDLTRRADEALYRAKAKGKNRVSV